MKNIQDILNFINQELSNYKPHLNIDVIDKDTFTLSFDLKVKTQASKNKLLFYSRRGFVLDITYPPVDGEANNGLISFLAKSFGVSQSCGELLKGEKSKQKSVRFNFFLKPEKNLDYFLAKIKETILFIDER